MALGSTTSSTAFVRLISGRSGNEEIQEYSAKFLSIGYIENTNTLFTKADETFFSQARDV